MNSGQTYVNITENGIKDFTKKYLPWSVWHKRLFTDAEIKYSSDSAMYDPIEIYAGYGARDINAFLRGQVDRCSYESIINTLRLSILSAPRISENIYVYRWVPQLVINELMRFGSKTYHEFGFLSSSIIPILGGPYNFKDDRLLKIRIDKGTPAAFVDLIVNRNENELLFLDDLWLKYVDKYHDKQYDGIIYEVDMIQTHIII